MKSLLNSVTYALLSICLCFPLLKDTAIAQEYLDFQALAQETRKISRVANDMTIVWWLPDIICQFSLSRQPYLTQTQIGNYLKSLRPYTLFIVLDGKIDAAKTMTLNTDAALRNILQLEDNSGNQYQSIRDENISADTREILKALKPGLIEILGLNTELPFFLFPAKSPQGITIADVKGIGSFTVKVGSKSFKWHLPLDSLLPEKKCLSCGSDCKGSWQYCPWCGKKLITIIK